MKFDAGNALFARELRSAVAVATDETFLSELCIVSGVSATGTDAASILVDLQAAITDVMADGARPFVVVSAQTALNLSLKPVSAGSGQLAFPDMSVTGGNIGGIPVVVSASVQWDTSGCDVIVLDANGVAADTSIITVDASAVASIAMDSAPADQANSLVSLFQAGAKGLKAERWFAFKRLRETAVSKGSTVLW